MARRPGDSKTHAARLERAKYLVTGAANPDVNQSKTTQSMFASEVTSVFAELLVRRKAFPAAPGTAPDAPPLPYWPAFGRPANVVAEEIRKILFEAEEEIAPRRFAMFATFLYTGARKGEVCGLRWQDVDLDKRVIMVRRSYSGPTKSAKHRDVPIPVDLVAIPRQHRNEEPYGGQLVFPNDRGEVYSKNGKLEDVLRLRSLASDCLGSGCTTFATSMPATS